MSDTSNPFNMILLSNALINEPTEAEMKKGYELFNKLLFKEYYTWWNVFVQEAKENPYEWLTAIDRFSIHCAKILKKETDIKNTNEELEMLVAGWYTLHFVFRNFKMELTS